MRSKTEEAHRREWKILCIKYEIERLLQLVKLQQCQSSGKFRTVIQNFSSSYEVKPPQMIFTKTKPKKKTSGRQHVPTFTCKTKTLSMHSQISLSFPQFYSKAIPPFTILIWHNHIIFIFIQQPFIRKLSPIENSQ